jgi:hypothetical protein
VRELQDDLCWCCVLHSLAAAAAGASAGRLAGLRAYRPAVQNVLVLERPVCCLLLFEGHETKASRLVCDSVPHHDLHSRANKVSRLVGARGGVMEA